MAIVNEADGPAIEGACGVEEALPLLEALAGGAALSLGRCTHLHTAPLQVLLALRPPLRDLPAEPFLARWVAPLLTGPRE
ncbi:hypothetical protein [Phaeospirillum tilakii]|uniref:Uncharacterized protein n=1 Tax=Phaeospirillum tilakii TaxID=741673 RepID=A0ABW5CEU2_9PROT